MGIGMAESEKQAANKGGAITTQSLIIFGLLLAVIGAVLAFALDELDAGSLNIQALGGILLATGAVLAVGASIIALGGNGGSRDGAGLADPTSLKSIVGLVAVLAGVVAVTALTIITVTSLSDQSSEIAVTSSAFGVISGVVTAYLGIKITAEAGVEAGGKAKAEGERAASANTEAKAAQRDAAVATHRATQAQQVAAKVKSVADEVLPEEKKEEFEEKVKEAEEKGAKVEKPSRLGDDGF
jgi:hypothetical protein